MPWMRTLPFADDPGGVALHIRGYFIQFKLVARLLLGRCVKPGMNDIINALLLPAAHNHRACIHFDSQILDCGQRAGDLLAPSTALLRHMSFLRQALRKKGQRRQHGQYADNPDL